MACWRVPARSACSILATAQGVGTVIDVCSEPDRGEQFARTGTPLGASNAAEGQCELDDASSAVSCPRSPKSWKTKPTVAVSKRGELVTRHGIEGMACNLDGSRLGCFEPAEQRQQRGLAGTGGTDDRHDLPRRISHPTPSRTVREPAAVSYTWRRSWTRVSSNDSARPAGVVEASSSGMDRLGDGMVPAAGARRQLASPSTIDLGTEVDGRGRGGEANT